MTSPTSTPEPGSLDVQSLENLFASLVHFGPSADGAVERDLAAALERNADALSARDARIAELEGERAALIKAVADHVTVRGEYFARAEAAEKAVAGLVRQVAKGQDRIEAMADALAAAERKVGEMREALVAVSDAMMPGQARKIAREALRALDKGGGNGE
jgi:chromosome segregation ATPase